MAASNAREVSQERDGRTRARLGLSALARLRPPPRLTERLTSLAGRARGLPSWLVAAAVLALSVAFVGAITYEAARIFSGRAADTRASSEAASFAEDSSRIATGEAFDGYIQVLRYADDPVVRSKASTPEQRARALRELLFLNVNKFSSLLIADRAGNILASTDPAITTVQISTAFALSRGHLGPANSDILLPEAGKPGYIEFTAPLREDDGAVWAILLGRADPSKVWRGTLAAAVDGSRNVIINSQGQYSAGVPDELLRLPWQGMPMANGSVRANVAGVDSICGLAPIGKDTQMDRGLSIASCLPASIIQAERARATDKQVLVTLAAAVLALVAGGAALKLALSPTPATPRAATGAAPEAGPEALAGVFGAPPVTDEAPSERVPEPEPAPPATTFGPLPPPDVDALALIDAYERRAARLADRLREQVQARLLIATTQADEAFRLLETDGELARELHVKAIGGLESLRDRELRVVGHELYPGLVRLGLPAALRAMRKDLADVIEVRLDLDRRADAISGDGPTAGGLARDVRLLLYRFAVEAVRAFAFGGASMCDVALQRARAAVSLTVAGLPAEGEAIGDATFDADALAAEAHAGTFEAGRDGGRFEFRITLPTVAMDEGPGESGPIAQEDASLESASAETSALNQAIKPDLARLPLPAALEALQAEMFGALVVGIEAEPGVDEVDWDAAISPERRRPLYEAVRASLHALERAGARRSTVAVAAAGESVRIELRCDGALASFDPPAIEDAAAALIAAGGSATVEPDGEAVCIVMRAPIEVAQTA